jgi:hypothetical protein
MTILNKSKEIEESNYSSLECIESGYNTIRLKNNLSLEVDGSIIAEHFSRVEGIDRIEILVIEFSSYLKNVEVIKGLPNLRCLQVNGNKIITLDGLEWFRRGEYVNINTGSKKRRITMILHAPIERMHLQFERKEDYDDIANSLTIKQLTILKGMDINFETWRNVPLEFLSLKSCKFKEFGDTAQVESLKKMDILGCRNLEKFVGDNSNITWLLIWGSKRLDVRTINTFSNIESLGINGMSNDTNLSDFGKLEQIKVLTLWNCKVNIDISNLKSNMPKLEKLQIPNMKEDQALELSKLNPWVSISGKGGTFFNGSCV